MKIDFALLRKKADTYRSQGLHKEALQLYAKFVACSAKIDPGTKSFIEKQIDRIELEMKCGDTGATQELPADRIELIKKGRGKSAIKSDLILCAQGQHHPSGCNQRDEPHIEDSDWLDGMADIYALVANDKDHSSSNNLKGKSVFSDTTAPKLLLTQDSPKRKRFHRDYNVKSFLKGIAAFVLVGSIFYFVDWLSDFKRDKSDETVRKAALTVFKKMPTVVNNNDTSTLPHNGMEDQSAMLPEETAVIGDTQPVVGAVEAQEVARNLSSPRDENKIADGTPGDDFQKDGTSYSEMSAVENSEARTSPKEPDPASVIDYVFKKRGL